MTENDIEILPGYDELHSTPDTDMRVVLYGYGRVKPTDRYFVDGYEFVGGVGRNIPRHIAECWKKGVRFDGKPAISRIYPQAILPNTADDIAIAKAVKSEVVAPEYLARLISVTDAEQLAEAMGKREAIAFAESLLKQTTAKGGTRQ